MGTHSGRKAQYARLLVDALELDRVPRPLDDVLARATARSGAAFAERAPGWSIRL